jgi:hypothetical protein
MDTMILSLERRIYLVNHLFELSGYIDPEPVFHKGEYWGHKDIDIPLSSGMWDKQKSEFFNGRYLGGEFEHMDEFINHERLLLNSITIEDIPEHLARVDQVAMFLTLKNKYLQFLEHEAYNENLDFSGFRTLERNPKIQWPEWKSLISDLYTQLKEEEYVTCREEDFIEAFSGRPTKKPLKIRFRASKANVYHFIQWMHENSIIETRDRYSVIKKSVLFYNWNRIRSRWDPIGYIADNAGKIPTSPFKPLEVILRNVFSLVKQPRK